MANGITTKQMLQTILENFNDFKVEIKTDIKDLFHKQHETDTLSKINENTLKALTKLVIGGVIVSIGSLLTAIFTLISIIIKLL